MRRMLAFIALRSSPRSFAWLNAVAESHHIRLRQGQEGRAEWLCSAKGSSEIDLLGDRDGIVDLDPEIPNCAFDFRVAQQKLNGTQVPRPPVNQRGLGATRECVPNNRGSRPMLAIQLETRREYCRVEMQRSGLFRLSKR